MTKLEEAREALAHALFKYSGLGALHINDLRDEVEALIRAAKDEEAEAAAKLAEMSCTAPHSICHDWIAADIRARIAKRKKEKA